MEILYFGIALGALLLTFRLGRDAGREAILSEQSSVIEHALLDNDSKFYLDTGLHGTNILPGHENRWPPNYVVVKHTDLIDHIRSKTIDALEPAFETAASDGDEQDVATDDAALLAKGPLYMPSELLEKVTGPGPLHPAMATRRAWAYILENGLQDPERKIIINCDEALAAVMGQAHVSMFGLSKQIEAHLSAVSQLPPK
jgi:hypothetical protein